MTPTGAALRVEVRPALEQFGPEWDPLFAAGPGLQSGRAWFAASAAAALPPGGEPRFVAIRAGDDPLALIPMVAGPGGRWASLTTPYTCLFQPLVRPEAGPPLLRAAGTAFGRYSRRWPITLLEALDPAWSGLAPFRAGLGAARLVTRSFAHFGNWHGPVAGGSWQSYLQDRPGALRETIRRKTRVVERDPAIRLELVRQPADFGPALAAYEAVYAKSWKEPEPYPHFNATLIRALAETGSLRIGLMWAGAQPIAAQYWTVAGGVATVLKLAHDDELRQFSPGTVLTAYVIRALIEQDAVTELDFGRGDDAYKQAWAGHRRARIGLLAINPLTLAGLAAFSRHETGRLFRTATFVMRRKRR